MLTDYDDNYDVRLLKTGKTYKEKFTYRQYA